MQLITHTAQKMRFSIKDFFSNCGQIPSFQRIWSHLLKKSLMVKFLFYAVSVPQLKGSLRKCLTIKTMESKSFVNYCSCFRSSRPEVFCKRGVLRNFAKFAGKHLCQSLILIRTPPVAA